MEWWINGKAAFRKSGPLQQSINPINHHPNQTGVPSRTLTSNLEFRILPLCALSYGDETKF